MIAALRTEYRKMMTTRMWWVLLVVMSGYMLFLAGIMAFSIHFAFEEPGAPAIPSDVIVRSVYAVAASFGYPFPVIVGALSVTGEFRHKTITPTLLAEPRRDVVLGAKLLAGIPVGLFYGLAGTLATVGTGAGVLAALGRDPMLGDPAVLRGIVMSTLTLAVWTVVGVALGVALPNQVAAIVVLIAFTQFLEPTFRILATFVSWGPGVARFLPGAAGEAMTGGSVYDAFATMPGSGGIGLLNEWQGAAVLVAYALVLAAIGRFTTLRKDIS